MRNPKTWTFSRGPFSLLGRGPRGQREMIMVGAQPGEIFFDHAPQIGLKCSQNLSN